MITFSIVDDDLSVIESLKEYLKKFYNGKFSSEEIEIKTHENANKFLETFKGDTDICFMDIDMPGTNGMEAVKKLRELKGGKDVIVIFVTNLAQYAINGYEVSAFDFIVKPVSYSQFSLKLERLNNYLLTTKEKELCVANREGKFKIKVHDIKYIEIMKHVITFHLTNSSITASGTLKSIMDELNGLPFALCNRCYLVNLKYVSKIKGNDLFIGDKKLLISGPKKKTFLSKFNEYLASGGNVK